MTTTRKKSRESEVNVRSVAEESSSYGVEDTSSVVGKYSYTSCFSVRACEKHPINTAWAQHGSSAISSIAGVSSITGILTIMDAAPEDGGVQTLHVKHCNLNLVYALKYRV